MMRRAGLTLSAVALGILVAPSAWADVIPSKRKPAGGAERVEGRLAAVGASAVEAREQADAMTSADALFFQRSDDAVQVVAGLTMEEWLLAGIAAIVLAAIVFWIIDRTPK